MQTLVFNTVNKTIKVYADHAEMSQILYDINHVSTVRIDSGFYEIMEKHSDGFTKPVLRLPISNTIMLLQHE